MARLSPVTVPAARQLLRKQPVRAGQVTPNKERRPAAFMHDMTVPCSQRHALQVHCKSDWGFACSQSTQGCESEQLSATSGQNAGFCQQGVGLCPCCQGCWPQSLLDCHGVRGIQAWDQHAAHLVSSCHFDPTRLHALPASRSALRLGRLCSHRLLGLVTRHRGCHCGEHRLRVDWGWAGAALALLLRLAPTLTGAGAAAVTGAGAAAWPAGSQGSAASLDPGIAVASCSRSMVLPTWLAG